MAACALVGAADFNERCFLAQWEAGRFAQVIAVDRGFAALSAIGCSPDVAMGDFDSLGFVPVVVPETTEVLTFPAHKDESDMELALRLVQERGFDEAVVYGALGGRLDHTLANLQLLAAFSERGLRVCAVDRLREDGGRVKSGASTGHSASDDEKMAKLPLELPIGTALTFLTGPAELVLEPLEPHSGGTVSVFSLSDASLEVTERGLAYPLDGVTLTNRTTWGLSNELTDQPAVVSVAAGTVVVFHPLYDARAGSPRSCAQGPVR